MLGEDFLIDARLVVHAIEVGDGDELDEVAVAGFVLSEEGEVIGGVAGGAGLFLGEFAQGHVHLAADDGLDAGFLGLLVEFDGAEEVAVIGHGDGGHAEIAGFAHDVGDAAGAVEHGVLGVEMEVDEGIGGHRERNIGREGGNRNSKSENRRGELNRG